jgi:hypothetical protein
MKNECLYAVPRQCMNTVRLAEEMYEEQGKDGKTDNHKPGTSSDDLRPVLEDD